MREEGGVLFVINNIKDEVFWNWLKWGNWFVVPLTFDCSNDKESINISWSFDVIYLTFVDDVG